MTLKKENKFDPDPRRHCTVPEIIGGRFRGWFEANFGQCCKDHDNAYDLGVKHAFADRVLRECMLQNIEDMGDISVSKKSLLKFFAYGTYGFLRGVYAPYKWLVRKINLALGK